MNSKYINKTHTYGKIWMLVTLCLFISVPVLICVHLGVSPKINMIAKGPSPTRPCSARAALISALLQAI